MHLIFNFLFSGLQGKAEDCNKYSTWHSQPEGVLSGILKNTAEIQVSVQSQYPQNSRSETMPQFVFTRPELASAEPLTWLPPVLQFWQISLPYACKHTSWSALELHPDKNQSYWLCRRQLSPASWHRVLLALHGLGDIQKQWDRGSSWGISICISRS